MQDNESQPDIPLGVLMGESDLSGGEDASHCRSALYYQEINRITESGNVHVGR